MDAIKRTRKITITDIARELGVSKPAVSLALNPRKSNVRISEKTAERIREYAQACNFRLNTNARSVSSGRLLNIGYFEGKRSPKSFPLIGVSSGVYDAASRSGYRVVMIKLPEQGHGDKNPIPFVFRESHLDALVVSHHGHLPKACKKAIDESCMPVVYLNEKKRFNAIYVDDYAASHRLTQFFIDQGISNIAYYERYDPTIKDIHYSTKDRLKGYLKAMNDSGIAPEVLKIQEANWLEEWTHWWQQNNHTDAILCSGSYNALQLFRALYKHNIRVPDNLQLASFGNTFAELCPVPLTTMFIPFYEMGLAAAEMAIQMIETSEAAKIPSQVFEMELVERESTK